MYEEKIVVLLPLPSGILSPNCKIFSRRAAFMKASAAKKYRQLAKESVGHNILETMPWPRVSVQPVFYYKVNRKRDVDNAIAMLKSAYDGFVDAGIVKDDDPENMSRETPIFRIDKIFPRVMFCLERMEKATGNDYYDFC